MTSSKKDASKRIIKILEIIDYIGIISLYGSAYWTNIVTGSDCFLVLLALN
jgi:hypothetical protein